MIHRHVDSGPLRPKIAFFIPRPIVWPEASKLHTQDLLGQPQQADAATAEAREEVDCDGPWRVEHCPWMGGEVHSLQERLKAAMEASNLVFFSY